MLATVGAKIIGGENGMIELFHVGSCVSGKRDGEPNQLHGSLREGTNSGGFSPP